MGYLLGRISDRVFGRTGVLISAIVNYLDANDAGPGFYKLAQAKGLNDRHKDSAISSLTLLSKGNAASRSLVTASTRDPPFGAGCGSCGMIANTMHSNQSKAHERFDHQRARFDHAQ
jgi:hypothetical protein